jgi:hypothetical protein
VKLFTRKRDQIVVALNDHGRAFVATAARAVLDASGDPHHDWHTALHAPMESTRPDDPLAAAARQQMTDTAAELVLLTVQEERLTEEEAWAWLRTLQTALRSLAVAEELNDQNDIEARSADVQQLVTNLQVCLWSLGKALAAS